MNTLWQLVHEYPEQNWDWDRLSDRVPLSFVAQHPDLPWKWNRLSQRFAEQVYLYPELPWNWRIITDSVPLSLINKYHWLPWRLGQLPAKEADVLAYPNIQWESYDNISLAFVVDHPEAKWDWCILSYSCDWLEIVTHPELPWNVETLMSRVIEVGDTPPTSFVLKTLDWPWPWEWLYDDGVITSALLRAYPQIPYRPKESDSEEDESSEVSTTLIIFPDLDLMCSPSDYVRRNGLDKARIEACIAAHSKLPDDFWYNLSRITPKEADAALLIQRTWRRYYYSKNQRHCCSLLQVMARISLE